MRYAVVMAGGSGTRLWPMSRAAQPKQLLPLIEIHGTRRSLLEIAVERLDGLVPPERRLVCAAEAYRGAIEAAIPTIRGDQYLAEPMGRDTVNAVGFAAAVLASRDPEAIFAVLTADHLIEPRREFARAIDLGFRLVEGDPARLVTFSIVPTFPATGYGYVERGPAIDGFDGAFRATRFVEKPNLADAERYLGSGRFGWNSGMFVFSARTVMKTLGRYRPDIATGLARIADAWATPRRIEILREVYPTLFRISVDFALMEPAVADPSLSVCTVPMDIRWKDVGSWPSYGETLAPDVHGNRANAPTVHLDSHNMLCVSDDPSHTISTIGCRDLIIVRTADATLVADASRSEEVKTLAGLVKQELR